MHPFSASRAGLLAIFVSGCAVLAPDPARDARNECDKKHDGAACFLAASQVVEKNGGEVNADAVRLYKSGCAVRSSACCEALGNVKGPLREQALVDACNGGDVVSCVRRANELPKDEAGQNEARALVHNACKSSTTIKSGVSAREMEGIGEACAALSKMIANGEGGGKDAVAAAKLEVLAAVIREEALYQHEREDDGKVLPRPAQALAPAKRGGGILDSAPVDPTAAERAKFRKEYEARRAGRDAWMASVDQTSGAKAALGDPTMPTLSPFERASGTGAPSCQTCTDRCGGMARCTGDDFSGGCGALKASDPSGYDTCVAECVAKADACTKACGECGGR